MENNNLMIKSRVICFQRPSLLHQIKFGVSDEKIMLLKNEMEEVLSGRYTPPSLRARSQSQNFRPISIRNNKKFQNSPPREAFKRAHKRSPTSVRAGGQSLQPQRSYVPLGNSRLYSQVADILKGQGITNVTAQSMGQGGFGNVYFGTGEGVKDVAIKMEKTWRKVRPNHGEVNGLGLPKKSGLQVTKGIIICDKHEQKFHYITSQEELRRFQGKEIYLVGTISRAREEGDLKAFIDNVKTGKVQSSPAQNKKIAQSLAHSIHNFHRARPGEQIGHRDIKPANVLLKRKEGELVAKLADFGLSSPDHEASGNTPAYRAPEAQKTQKSDWYSYGKTLYTLITGEVPSDQPNLYHPKIRKNPQLKDLLEKLLQEDPNQRLCGEDVLNHPYFA